ncbi:hypothetical protein F5888DRAFT_1804186 [Russula emetica]|nr:hypothetical protein F5888DRAFT_1804186 [Russula emetica]
MSTNPNIPRLPSRPGGILLGGATIIGGIFAGTWFYMSTKQARKASREYRMRQPQTQTVETPRPRGGNALSGTSSGSGSATAHQIIEPRTLPLDAPNRDPGSSDRSQLGTLSPGEEALRSESGAKMQPVPQRDRDRGDGLP